jgi:ABC-type Fe3+/spermidine/putrescine transport system ATPase subunit
MATVELSGVQKRYGETPVVKGLSLTVASGEFVSLLGPSGCGKTTTLRLIAGLERLDAGLIRLDGHIVDDTARFVPPERRGLGMVFQSYAVWPHRTVAQNVAYPLTLQRVPSAELGARVAEALEWVQLGALAHRSPSQLSGGQLQRVAIARALVARPQVLLFDEPLSNLDAALRDELRGEIAALRARLGITMIFVTHDQHEALALADRVAVMNAGVIEQVDRPELLYQAPSTPFVARFVGGANVLEGHLEGRIFTCQGQRFELPVSGAAATLSVRPEHVRLGVGTPLPLRARLFLGSATEYRFSLGQSVLRAVGPAVEAKVGELVPVSFSEVRLYPA